MDENAAMRESIRSHHGILGELRERRGQKALSAFESFLMPGEIRPNAEKVGESAECTKAHKAVCEFLGNLGVPVRDGR